MNKPSAGHFAKASVEAGKALKEFRLDSASELEVGAEISVATFEAGAMVMSQAIKGKGFQGVIKRYNFRTQDATHGNSLSQSAWFDRPMPDSR